MRSTLAIVVMATVLTGCAQNRVVAPEVGVAAVNVPVVSRADYTFDVAAPYGGLAPSEADRLDAWFRSLNIGFGDRVFVEGGSPSAREDAARIAGSYGLLVNDGAPVTAGRAPSGSVRVVVSRAVASVPGCPNWDRAAQPNFENKLMPNFGCGVNANLAAQVADPSHLASGRDGSSTSDGFAAAKAIQTYRDWPLTAIKPGQELRPLKNAATSAQSSEDK